MDALKTGWFSELSPMWPGLAQSLEVTEVLHNKKSDFQDVMVFKTKAWGTVLTLDGAIQCTDFDEFSYHEMMAHIPAFASPTPPRRALIVGGGDGGVARELLKHASIESIDLVDIDQAVMDVSRLHFPALGAALDSPKVKALAADAAEFIKTAPTAEYDVAIVDSSDPEGPASVLFGAAFHSELRRVLKPTGVMVCQAESAWLHGELIAKMAAFLRAAPVAWPSVEYAMISMPSYPSGVIGFLCASNAAAGLSAPARPLTDAEAAWVRELRYYSPEGHRAAFVLPAFVRRRLAA